MAYRNTITSLKTSDEELEVEYELVSNIEQNYKSSTQYDINNFIAELDERLVKNQAVLDDLNSNIDRLTNHADGFDYAISACSGVLCGFVDSFFVGEFNFEELKADSNKHVNKFVEKYAKLSGWDGNGRLMSAVEFLESVRYFKYKITPFGRPCPPPNTMWIIFCDSCFVFQVCRFCRQRWSLAS